MGGIEKFKNYVKTEKKSRINNDQKVARDVLDFKSSNIIGAASIIIHDKKNNKYLSFKNIKHNGMMGPVAGKKEDGESFRACAIRELKEEVNCSDRLIEMMGFVGTTTVSRNTDGKEWKSRIFVFEIIIEDMDGVVFTNMEHHKHYEFGWKSTIELYSASFLAQGFKYYFKREKGLMWAIKNTIIGFINRVIYTNHSGEYIPMINHPGIIHIPSSQQEELTKE